MKIVWIAILLEIPVYASLYVDGTNSAGNCLNEALDCSTFELSCPCLSTAIDRFERDQPAGSAIFVIGNTSFDEVITISMMLVLSTINVRGSVLCHISTGKIISKVNLVIMSFAFIMDEYSGNDYFLQTCGGLLMVSVSFNKVVNPLIKKTYFSLIYCTNPDMVGLDDVSLYNFDYDGMYSVIYVGDAQCVNDSSCLLDCSSQLQSEAGRTVKRQNEGMDGKNRREKNGENNSYKDLGTNRKGNIYFTNCSFVSLSTTACGGALQVNQTQALPPIVEIANCTFQDCLATKFGGAISIVTRHLSFVSFPDYSYTDDDGIFVPQYCTFINCTTIMTMDSTAATDAEVENDECVNNSLRVGDLTSAGNPCVKRGEVVFIQLMENVELPFDRMRYSLDGLMHASKESLVSEDAFDNTVYVFNSDFTVPVTFRSKSHIFFHRAVAPLVLNEETLQYEEAPKTIDYVSLEMLFPTYEDYEQQHVSLTHYKASLYVGDYLASNLDGSGTNCRSARTACRLFEDAFLLIDRDGYYVNILQGAVINTQFSINLYIKLAGYGTSVLEPMVNATLGEYGQFICTPLGCLLVEDVRLILDGSGGMLDWAYDALVVCLNFVYFTNVEFTPSDPSTPFVYELYTSVIQVLAGRIRLSRVTIQHVSFIWPVSAAVFVYNPDWELPYDDEFDHYMVKSPSIYLSRVKFVDIVCSGPGAGFNAYIGKNNMLAMSECTFANIVIASFRNVVWDWVTEVIEYDNETGRMIPMLADEWLGDIPLENGGSVAIIAQTPDTFSFLGGGGGFIFRNNTIVEEDPERFYTESIPAHSRDVLLYLLDATQNTATLTQEGAFSVYGILDGSIDMDVNHIVGYQNGVKVYYRFSDLFTALPPHERACDTILLEENEDVEDFRIRCESNVLDDNRCEIREEGTICRQVSDRKSRSVYDGCVHTSILLLFYLVLYVVF